MTEWSVAVVTAVPSDGPVFGKIPETWDYLGCFQDAISRTLLGSKPTDYLQGNMSNSECINHCGSRGYGFAGTEHGQECWCGNSIRDDAVRLPEKNCGTPCQGTSELCCGGDWAISVYMLPTTGQQPHQANPGSVAQLLENIRLI